MHKVVEKAIVSTLLLLLLVCEFFPYTVLLRHTQRWRSGLKKMSLRRSAHHRQKPVPRSLPTDLPDGRQDQDERAVQLPDVSPADSKISSSSFSTAGSQLTTESMESMSISSASEFSATGTDERSATSPLGDGDSSVSVEFTVGRNILRRNLSDSPVDMSLDRTDDFYLKRDSGTGMQHPAPKLACKPLKPRPLVSTLPRMKRSSSSTEPSSDRKYSSPLELLPPPVKPMRDYSKRKRAGATVKSVMVEPESDSDTDNKAVSGDDRSPQNPRIEMSRSSTLEDDNGQEDDGHSRSGTLRASREGSQETLVNTSSTIPSTTADEDHSKILVKREVASKAETTPTHSLNSPGASSQAPVQDVPGNQEESSSDLLEVSRARSKSNSKRPLPANSIGMVLNHSSSSPFKPVTRNRSMSGNPQVKKKPKPLPRLSIKKFDSNKLEKREALLISSLPADFKPIPVARDRRNIKGSKADNEKEKTMENESRTTCNVEVEDLFETEKENVSVLAHKTSEDTHVVDPVAIVSTSGAGVVESGIPGNLDVTDEDTAASGNGSVIHSSSKIQNGSNKNKCNGEESGTSAVDTSKENSGACANQNGIPLSTVKGTATSNETAMEQVASSEQSSGESNCLSPTDFVEVDPPSAAPVRPPRRKKSTLIKKKKELISLPITASEHTSGRSGADDIPTCSSSSTTSCDQSPAHAVSSDFVMVEHQSGSKDHSYDSIRSKSRELDESGSGQSQDIDGDRSQDLSANLLFPENDEPLSPLVEGLRNPQIKNSSLGPLQNRGSQNRGSQNSMMVNTGSTPSHPSGLFRPYSMMLSGDEGFVNGGGRSSDFFTVGNHFSLPRQQSSVAPGAAAMNRHTLDYRLSVKLSPASSKIHHPNGLEVCSCKV